MSVRKVEEKIKAKFKGVGPSASTIHHYVVNLGLVGASLQKIGLEGNITKVAHQALCTALLSMIQINELNCKVSTHTSQIQWIMAAMNCGKKNQHPFGRELLGIYCYQYFSW